MLKDPRSNTEDTRLQKAFSQLDTTSDSNNPLANAIANSINEPPTSFNSPAIQQHRSTYCKYSGVELARTPVLFDSEHSMHIAKHWLFTQNYHAIIRYHHNQKFKTHAHKSMLALALILSPQVLGSKVSIQFPAIFNELKLKRNYMQIVVVAKALSSMTKERRNSVLANTPSFSSNAFKIHRTEPQPDFQMEALGSALINYVAEIITAELYSSQWLGESTIGTLEAEITKIELDFHKAKKDQLANSTNLSTSSATPKSQYAVPITEYWTYILEEIQVNFELADSELASFRQQLKTPTNKPILNTIASYLRGLTESSKIKEHDTIPTIQFRNAYLEIHGLIQQLTKLENELDLAPTINNLKPKVEVFKLGSSSQADGLDLIPAQPTQIEGKVDLADSASKFSGTRLGNILSNLASITATKQEAQEAKQNTASQQAADFVIRVTDNNATGLANLESTDLDLTTELDLDLDSANLDSPTDTNGV